MDNDAKTQPSIGSATSPPDDKPGKREILVAKISAPSAEGWRCFCEQNGISLTAMLEIVCRDLGDGTLPASQEGLDQLVVSAREVDRARRSRSRRK
ncbi:MAG: hypothetical protein HKN60_01895 [Rhizobiales bacterium]|nr:hypothetical protein [Hyphomicrobiales bacterium]